ncbi:MAG: alpha/beta fold hydrolase [Anaerolineae bacterium]|nr:alpha/beta fold hydrolase [Anaerolineae bacterium]
MDVSLADGDCPLPATLTMPKGAGPFPAVVLVHGSGPNDRDETIGPNKPFKDLAWGLATRGIAVLRYEKRTKQSPGQMIASMPTLTVNEEVVNDALAATEYLRGVSSIDPKRVFVLGHSLGGTVAPRIAARDPRLAGLILLAASNRNLADLMLEQSEYLASLDGTVAAEEARALDELRQQVERVKALDFKEGEVILGAGKAYWADILAYDPVATAQSLAVPMLILQGERDYQVTMADFAAWKAGLADRPGVQFKSYPSLNHLFMAGSGHPNPAEYNVAGNVAREVVDDIASWIARLP